jgi:hypothetical protein
MMLFKAKRVAEKEYEDLVQEKGLTPEEAKQRVLSKPKTRWGINYTKHHVAGTAANFLKEVA